MCQVLDVVLDAENIVVSYTVFATALKADSPLNSTASFFFLRLFLEQFRFTTTLRGRDRDFPYPSPLTCARIASPIINIVHQDGAFE